MTKRDAPICCDNFMELKSSNKIGQEETRKFGIKHVFKYHFQCKVCGKTKSTEARE